MKKRTLGAIFCLSVMLLLSCFAWSAGDVIPRGTEVVVRTDSDISMATVKPGDTFSATVDQDVLSRGKIVVNRGTRAEIRMVSLRSDTDEVAFNLYSISINGRPYRVSSDTARQYQERQSTTVTQKPSLLGAAGGALLGGATGGGQGAVTGAIVGAEGGYSWTGQSRLSARISSGTRFLFTIRDEVALRK